MTSASVNSCATDARTGPAWSLDLDVVRDNYQAFARALPDTPRVLRREGESGAGGAAACSPTLGSCFDTASVAEIEMALAAGATPDRISFGNTIKKERDIARAFELGVRLFAVDCEAEVEKIARAGAAGARRCSAASCATAPAPNGRCRASSAACRRWRSDVLEHAHRLGLEAYGVSFHVGSQQRNTEAWDQALASASAIFRECAERGIQPLDGQSRRRLPDEVPEGRAGGREPMATAIFRALSQALRQPPPGDDHRAGPRHGRQRRHDRGRGRAGLEEESRRGRGALGLSRHRQVRRPRRDDGRVDPLSDPHRRTTATAWRPACSPARPATRPTCSTRRSRTCCPVTPRDRRQGADRGHGRLHDDLFGGRVQRLPAAQDPT